MPLLLWNRALKKHLQNYFAKAFLTPFKLICLGYDRCEIFLTQRALQWRLEVLEDSKYIHEPGINYFFYVSALQAGCRHLQEVPGNAMSLPDLLFFKRIYIKDLFCLFKKIIFLWLTSVLYTFWLICPWKPVCEKFTRYSKARYNVIWNGHLYEYCCYYLYVSKM